MTAPTYSEDLEDITLAEIVTGWAAYGGGAAGLGTGADLSFQGNLAVDKAVSSADKGQYFDNGSGITLPAGAHVFVWLANGTPGISDILANKGASILIGTSGTAYCQYHVEGNDTYGAAGRIARCYPVDYATRNGNTSAPAYRTVTGSPGVNPQVFGGGLKTTATAKGANSAIDAIRYGTGMYITAGDSSTPATFTGAAIENDTLSARWGICTKVGPTFEIQGRFVIGQDSGKVPTAAYFEDASGNTVLFLDTPHVADGFNQIIIDHESTVFNLTNITIKQEIRYPSGGTRKGRLVFNNANITSELISCTFDGFGIIQFRAGVIASNCIFRGTDKITLSGATLINCTIDKNISTTAVLTEDTIGAALVSGCNFISNGTGHGLEIGGSAANMTLTDDTWVGYASMDGSTGNEAVFINIDSGSMNLTINGGTIPSIRTAGVSVTVIAGAVAASVNVKNIEENNIQDANVLLQTASGGPFPFNVTITIANSGTTATVTHVAHGMASNDKVVIKGASHQANNGVFTITKINDNSYSYIMNSSPGSNPTGVIKVWFVILSGFTDINGNITMSRVFPSDQPVSGRVRKSSF
jgi:hypothetical protein